MEQPERHVLVAGASGVVGAAAVERFCADGWRVTALSRRTPTVAPWAAPTKVSADLTDAAACAHALRLLPPVTHLVYAAVAEAPGLVDGWFDAALIAANGRMFANILDPLAASGSLVHVSLLQGAKAYGAHHHPVEVPAREDAARDDHSNFYWLHEDHARRRAVEAGFGVTIFRPQVVLGAAPGAAMNPVAAIGAYAALCRERGRPFAFPGGTDAIIELVDSALLAEAFGWAATAPAARDQTFNITNGDVIVLRQAWPRLAAALGLDDVGEPPASLAAFFAAPEVREAWRRLAARHSLAIDDLPALLGQSHHYLDLLVGARIADKRLPVLLSTIKIRQAGFSACRDSVASILHWLDRMVGLRLLPPFGC